MEEAPSLDNHHNTLFEINISNDQPFQRELVLIGDQHYISRNTNDRPSPEWVVISTDPDIMHLLPVEALNGRGIIAARGQVSITDGILVVDPAADLIYPIDSEIEAGSLIPYLFLPKDALHSNPYRLCDEDPHIILIALLSQQLKCERFQMSWNACFNYSSQTLNQLNQIFFINKHP